MRKIFGPIVCTLAHAFLFPGEFANVTFWKSRNKKYLYYCMSETHITEEIKFLKVFPEAIRITQTEFDLLTYFYPERKVIHVADEHILAELGEEDITNPNDAKGISENKG